MIRNNAGIVALAATVAVAWVLSSSSALAYGAQLADPMVPTSGQLKSVVAAHFVQQKDSKPDDLVTQADAQQILTQLKQLGWRPSDTNEILALLLPANHIVPRTFATRDGKRFMRKVANFDLIYDRLHRTAELPGGKALIRDIVKLPNGEIYAKKKPRPGNPTLTELLPKQRNGKTPPPRNFDKPTGYIYTMPQLLERLEQSRQRDAAALSAL